MRVLGIAAGLSLSVVGMMTAMPNAAKADFLGCPSLNAITSSIVNSGEAARDNLTATGDTLHIDPNDVTAPFDDKVQSVLTTTSPLVPVFGPGGGCGLGNQSADADIEFAVSGTFNYAFTVEEDGQGVISFASSTVGAISSLSLFVNRTGDVADAIGTFNSSNQLVDADTGTIGDNDNADRLAFDGSPLTGSINFFNLTKGNLDNPNIYIIQVIAEANGASGNGRYSGELTVSAIPAPPALALLVTALFGLGGFKRKELAAKLRKSFA